MHFPSFYFLQIDKSTVLKKNQKTKDEQSSARYRHPSKNIKRKC